MLRELRIANLALAEDVVLRPGEHLTVLTGETGAGKSLVAGALALLAGEKADRGLVRQGADEAWVEALCDLSERPDLRSHVRSCGITLGEDGLLLLRREIRSEGRGRAVIDGRSSSLQVLAELGRMLFAIQSQDQKQELARPGFARDLLDDVLGLDDQRRAVAAALADFREAGEKLALRRQEQEVADQQLDMWRYQHDELVAAGLREGEEDELAEAIAVKRHAQAMLEAAATARELLDGGPAAARDALGAAQASLSPHIERSRRLASAHESLAAAADLAADAASELERFLDGFGADPRGLDDMESRKALYEELRRKYRRDVAGLLALVDELGDRLDRMQDSETELRALARDVEEARDALASASAALRAGRTVGAPRLAAAAETSIRPLALPELDVMVSVQPDSDPEGEIELDGAPCRVTDHGADRVALQVRTNPGESPGEVAAIASGGEAARIHLGLTVLRQRRQQPLVWLFDEIDAGLGMDSATPVALLLRDLAASTQVICITHLPTVAVHGRDHWRVVKRGHAGRTVIELEDLDADARIEEIARQLGGEGWRDDGEGAQTRYARQLLQGAGAMSARRGTS
jgi:DNA repair protein RecN (Recombination protein N)